MLRDPSVKYRPFPQVDIPDRTWPSKTITRAPRWLSTDMRDGNQALIDPMNAEKKQRFFDLLVKIGIKEIEVGFPSAGATEFDFIRGLVDRGAIPDDVMPQVLTQARADLIQTTFDSLDGAKQAVVHVYNAVSPAWRRIVFGLERPEIKAIAVQAARKRSTSASQVCGPKLTRTTSLATASSHPMACSTWLVLSEPDEQALPAETEMPAISN